MAGKGGEGRGDEKGNEGDKYKLRQLEDVSTWARTPKGTLKGVSTSLAASPRRGQIIRGEEEGEEEECTKPMNIIRHTQTHTPAS